MDLNALVSALQVIRDDATTPMNTAADIDQVLTEIVEARLMPATPNPAQTAVSAACDLAEAEARHVVDDEAYVAVGLIRNAINSIAQDQQT